MLFWVTIIVFAVPLYLFIRKTMSDKKGDERRLRQIQDRLREKKMEQIEAKKNRISSKK